MLFALIYVAVTALAKRLKMQVRFGNRAAAAIASLILVAAAAMTEIMKTQVELALQNRHVTVLAQPEAPVTPAVVSERSKAEKLQDAMEMEGRRRAQQIHDDRKRKFNSLDADAKEVTGAFLKKKCSHRLFVVPLVSVCEVVVTHYFLCRGRNGGVSHAQSALVRSHGCVLGRRRRRSQCQPRFSIPINASLSFFR